MPSAYRRPAIALAACLATTLSLAAIAAPTPFKYRVPVGAQANQPAASIFELRDAGNLVITSLAFPATAAGGTSSPVSITLVNTTAAAVTFGASPLLAAAPFAVESTTCPAGGTLASGASCGVSVTFSPAAAGDFNGSLQATLGAGTIQVLPLTGSGNALARTRIELTVCTPGDRDRPQFNAATYLQSLAITPSTTEDVQLDVTDCDFYPGNTAGQANFSTGVLPNGATLYLVNRGGRMTTMVDNWWTGAPVLQIDSPTVIESGEYFLEYGPVASTTAVVVNAPLAVTAPAASILLLWDNYPSTWPTRQECAAGSCVQYDTLVHQVTPGLLQCIGAGSCTSLNNAW